jgi:uncharacterized protein (DUF305 family)
MNAKNTLRNSALPAAFLAAALGLAGCGAGQGSGSSSTASSAAAQTDHGAHSMPMGSPAGSSSQGAFNAADAMFAQMMIPHHEQAVEMSGIVLDKPGLDGRVAALAEQIKAAQAPEIATLRGWLGDWGQPAAMPSTAGQDAGHGMEGMLSEDDLAKLRASDAASGAKLFLTQMIAHHEGAVMMAQSQLSSGANPDAVAMARSIVDSQTKEIDEMKSLLRQL